MGTEAEGNVSSFDKANYTRCLGCLFLNTINVQQIQETNATGKRVCDHATTATVSSRSGTLVVFVGCRSLFVDDVDTAASEAVAEMVKAHRAHVLQTLLSPQNGRL